MIFRLLIAAVATAPLLFSSACKKKGVNENLEPSQQVQYDFMSTKAGSEWTYGSRAGVEYTRYSRGHDTVKNGLTYSYFERQEKGAGSLTPEYFGKNGEKYITLLDLDGTATNYVEYVFWLENAGVGTKWDNTGTVAVPGGGSASARIESEQVGSEATMTFGGLTFTDVVHVHSKLKASDIGIPVGTVDIWFAKGVGVVREEAYINILGVYKNEHVDSLTAYKIVP